jgi:hypothetical protein
VSLNRAGPQAVGCRIGGDRLKPELNTDVDYGLGGCHTMRWSRMASATQPDPAARARGLAATPAADPAQTVTAHVLEAAPVVPAEASEELLALKAGAMFVCARPDGDIRGARASGEGFYA